jgi:hypothetical protein
MAFVRANNNEIALGIKMLDGSGRFLKESKRAFPSPVTSLFKLSGLSKFFPRSAIFAKYYLGNLDENKNHRVDVLAGAFMLVPKKILEKTGGFDEDFFMYGEDIDLSYRIQKAGFANYYFAESAIIHFKGESTRKESLKYVKIFYRSMRIFVKKHYGENKAGLYNFFLHAGIFFRGAVSAFSRIARKKTKAKIENPGRSEKVIIAGNQNEFEEAKSLCEKSANKTVIGRIDTDQTLGNDTIGAFADLKKVFSYVDVDEIIFCEGSLSFKQIIAAMTKVPEKVALKFLAENGHAIVGSDNKNLSGEIILRK